MNKWIIVCSALCLASPAFAQEGDPSGGMDMSKMGPWTRKPTNEKQTKKEIAEFFKQEEVNWKNLEAHLSGIDFPVFMLTDDAKGVPEGAAWDREKYSAMMKPMIENSPPDMKMKHKPTVTVLSDSLANVTDDFTMTMGKQKLSGRNMGVLVKRDGKWKWKMMGEAGWGGMSGADATAKADPKSGSQTKTEAKTESKPATKQ